MVATALARTLWVEAADESLRIQTIGNHIREVGVQDLDAVVAAGVFAARWGFENMKAAA